MVQVRSGLRLALEPFDERAIRRVPFAENLDRDLAAHQLVPGPAHLRHAADAYAFDDRVAASVGLVSRAQSSSSLSFLACPGGTLSFFPTPESSSSSDSSS